jgi:large subunit ribosomal protein L6
MSRIGKRPIKIPSGVTVVKKDHAITVKGPKGTLSRDLPAGSELAVVSDQIEVKINDSKVNGGAIQGLTRSLVANMVTGVSEGFERVLEINGVGYRVAVQGNKLNFSLGYSHPVDFQLPEGMTASVDKQTVLTLKGVDKEQLGSVAAAIRSFRSPEPYKGKGIKYAEERIVRKAGKTGK